MYESIHRVLSALHWAKTQNAEMLMILQDMRKAFDLLDRGYLGMRRSGSPYRDGGASTSTSDDDDDDDDYDLTKGDMPDATTIDRSGNAAANRLEAAIARIARHEGNPHERRERAQRIKRDILVARRLRGGLAPALKHAWGEPVD